MANANKLYRTVIVCDSINYGICDSHSRSVLFACKWVALVIVPTYLVREKPLKRDLRTRSAKMQKRPSLMPVSHSKKWWVFQSTLNKIRNTFCRFQAAQKKRIFSSENMYGPLAFLLLKESFLLKNNAKWMSHFGTILEATKRMKKRGKNRS